MAPMFKASFYSKQTFPRKILLNGYDSAFDPLSQKVELKEIVQYTTHHSAGWLTHLAGYQTTEW